MKYHHHPDASSLMSYAAGSLPDTITTVVACHVSVCRQCQQAVAEAEQVGQSLLDLKQDTAMAPTARENMLALLDEHPSEALQPEPEADTDSNPGDIPTPLQPLLGKDLDSLRWRTMAPGLKQFILPASDGALRLLRIAPGSSMPIHGHTGSELTMVLRGSYSDELGRFGAGDVADLDPDIEHQPATDTGEDCICLVATDAPLKFSGLVPRLLQPFFQL